LRTLGWKRETGPGYQEGQGIPGHSETNGANSPDNLLSDDEYCRQMRIINQ
jgi:hypothetical protein